MCEILLCACRTFDSADIVDSLIEFMIVTNKIVPEFENAIYDLLVTDDAVLEEYGIDSNKITDLFEKYRMIIISVPKEQLSKKILDHINSLDDLDDAYDYSLDVAQVLYDNQYYLMSTLVRLHSDVEIDFSDNNVVLGIKENVQWLKNRKEILASLRKEVLVKSNNLDEYKFLFTGEFPVVSKDEFALLTNNNCIDITNVLEYFTETNINVEAVEYIVRYFNREYRNNNIAFAVIRQLTKYSNEIIVAFFEKIDFTHSFLYYKFSETKKSIIKRLFSDSLELDTYEGKLNFMELTRFLDEKFDKSLLDNMDEKMEKRYVNLVSRRLGPNAVQMSTVDNLRSFNGIYSFGRNTGIPEKMWEEKEYVYYVVSTTCHAKAFVMESSPRREQQVWSTYLEIYSNPSKYLRTSEYMRNNKVFLKEIVENEDYLNFSDAVLETLSSVSQSKNLVNHIFKRGELFAIKYFASIKEGFADKEAARSFINAISLSDNRMALKNDSVRNNVYDKLIDPSLKNRYTRLRKSVGCKY